MLYWALLSMPEHSIRPRNLAFKPIEILARPRYGLGNISAA